MLIPNQMVCDDEGFDSCTRRLWLVEVEDDFVRMPPDFSVFLK